MVDHTPSSRLHRITRALSVALAVALVILVPLGYFVTAYTYESHHLHIEAHRLADKVIGMIYRAPRTWWFQEHRLQQILAPTEHDVELSRYELLDETGAVITFAGADIATVQITVEHDVVDGGQTVARIRVSKSLTPVLTRTVLSAVFGIIFALSTVLLLRWVPFRFLEQAWSELEDSRQLLANEVSNKEVALEKLEQLHDTMRHMALHDPLTGLHNRTQLDARLDQSLLDATRRGWSVAVYMMDLTNFREIVETLGHDVGDRVIKEVAGRLEGLLRRSDSIARISGGQFAVVCTLTAPDVEYVASKILQAFDQSYEVEGYPLLLSASIGVACFPIHAQQGADLLRCADIAMHAASARRSSFETYNETLDCHSESRLQLVSDLNGAIARDELFLVYQPQVDFKTLRVVGVEALLRWRHPTEGVISPGVFIPLAEQSGHIQPFTWWALKTALYQLGRWQRAGYDLGMAINLSAELLVDDSVPKILEEELTRSHVAAEQLTVEITENSIMADPFRANLILKDIHTLGMCLSVDDFGTGYSSLAYLANLPVDEVKVDRSFVGTMHTNQKNQTIVRSTIDLGHNLGLSVVAEGIENREAWDLLANLGCDLAQGYFLARPLPAEDLEEFLAKRFNPKAA